ncbi:MAG: RebB family R body protein [Sneathiella sp.]|nr:RebB family R body protein [Sneathiella sp.]
MTTNNDAKYSNPILDSVTAVNELVIGSAAPTAMASMYLTMAQAAGISAQNSATAQNHLNVLGTAALGAGTGNLLWEGLSRQVENITVNDRLKYWEQMIAITKGQPAPSSDAEETTVEGGNSNGAEGQADQPGAAGNS